MSDEASAAIFSDDQRAALSCVLDAVIPPSRDRRLPGAGELGLGDAIAEAAGANPAMRSAVEQGLAVLDDLARERSGMRFTAVAPAQRAELLQTVAAQQPGFVPNLIFPLYTTYYRHPLVLEALGLEARPPFPKGHAMEPFDERLLDGVRHRPKLYRDC
jgi:hypothetical protein